MIGERDCRRLDRGARFVRGDHVLSVALLLDDPGGDESGQHDGRQHDQRPVSGREQRDVGPQLWRRGHAADHEDDHGHDRPAPQDTHRQKSAVADFRRDFAHLVEFRDFGVAGGGGRHLIVRNAGVGREQSGNPDRQHDEAEHDIDPRPAVLFRQDEPDRTADEAGETETHLRDGGQDIERRDLVRHVDTPGVDADILRRAGEGADRGEQAEPAERGRGIERAHHHQCDADNQLHRRDPLLALTELAHARNIDPVEQRRPQELKRIGEAHEAEDAHRFEIDIRLGQPGIERAEEQRGRQALRKAEQQHEDGLAIAQRQAEHLPGASLRLSCHWRHSGYVLPIS